MAIRKPSTLLNHAVSRRSTLKGIGATALVGGIPFTRLSMAAAQDEEISAGGVLNVAISQDTTAGLDAQFTTATLTGNVAQHVLESLFADDASFSPKPHLVSDYELAADGMKLSMSLREGITFHNGAPLTAADVVASLNRWGVLSTSGRLAYGRLDSIEAIDDLTVEMNFNAPTGIILTLLAGNSAFIIPADMAEAAGEDQLTFEQSIGTGPFKFLEHEADRHLRLGRNDDYVDRDEPADGMSGKRTPYLDEIAFLMVQDPSVRANGISTGEYHWGDTLPPDYMEMLESDPAVTPLLVQPFQTIMAHLNKKDGLMTDKAMRNALQQTFSQEDALLAGFGRPDFILASPSMTGPETSWFSESGADNYNNPNPDNVAALLEEAGYDGTPVRWLANTLSPYNVAIAEFVRQEAEGAGIPIEIQVTDFATYSDIRADESQWDVFLTGHGAASHPARHVMNDAEWPGWWDNADKDALVADMIAAADDAALKTAIDSWTELIYEEMPSIMIGHQFELRAHSESVKGFVNTTPFYFWNVGLDS